MTEWFKGTVGVPFGNANYDSGLGGSHNMTFLLAPNTPITSITDGCPITDISSPAWGKQVTVKLQKPIEGHTHFSYQHFSAVDPHLKIGDIPKYGQVIGWSGGLNNPSEYSGTHNPTGSNFCDTPDMSSQGQIGIALCDGSGYGYDGWVPFPPIDVTLDPYPVVEAYIKATTPPPPDYRRLQFVSQWTSIVECSPDSGIANVIYGLYLNGIDHGPPHTVEKKNVDWEGKEHIYQIFGMGMMYWYPDGTSKWITFK